MCRDFIHYSKKQFIDWPTILLTAAAAPFDKKVWVTEPRQNRTFETPRGSRDTRVNVSSYLSIHQGRFHISSQETGAFWNPWGSIHCNLSVKINSIKNSTLTKKQKKATVILPGGSVIGSLQISTAASVQHHGKMPPLPPPNDADRKKHSGTFHKLAPADGKIPGEPTQYPQERRPENEQHLLLTMFSHNMTEMSFEVL